MAEEPQSPAQETFVYGSGVFKDQQTGKLVKVMGWTPDDVSAINANIQEVKNLKARVESINAGQFTVAQKDYFTTEEYKDEMVVGERYLVPFTAEDEYVPVDEVGNSIAPEQVQAYYQIVVKDADGVVHKQGKANINPTMKGYAQNAKDETITGAWTFSQDVTGPAEQNVDTLNDQKFATAKFVRDTVSKKINDAGHITAKFYADGEPAAESIGVNHIAFFASSNAITSA